MSFSIVQWITGITGAIGILLIPLKLVQRAIGYIFDKFLAPRAFSLATTAHELRQITGFLNNLKKFGTLRNSQTINDSIIK